METTGTRSSGSLKNGTPSYHAVSDSQSRAKWACGVRCGSCLQSQPSTPYGRMDRDRTGPPLISCWARLCRRQDLSAQGPPLCLADQQFRPRGDTPSYLLSIWIGVDPVGGESLSSLVDRLRATVSDPVEAARRILMTGFSDNRSRRISHFLLGSSKSPSGIRQKSCHE